MINQKGYVIKIVLVVFAIIIGLMIFPMKYPIGEGGGECAAGAPGNGEILRLPAPGSSQVKYYPDTDEYIYWDSPDQNNLIDYVQIRTNVYTTKDSPQTEAKNWTFLGTFPPTGLAHSMEIGELPVKPGYIAYYPTSVGEIDMPDGKQLSTWNEGLVYFMDRDPSVIREVNGRTYYKLEVYQKKEIFDSERGYETAELFPCLSAESVAPTEVVLPAQDASSDKKQLQLEWFLLNNSGFWGVHCKPAVYLYPEKKQLVNVKVFPKGELSYTDPLYDPARGWTVEAYPDGKLVTSNQIPVTSYPYLYYESKILDSEIEKPSKGWVVKPEDMEGFFNRILPQLGLNRKEKQDFMDYWLGKLPESPYYFVGLIEKGQRDYLEPLSVTPNPDTSIRFSFYFEPLNEFKTIEEPVINTPLRSGFTLVDWGGMIKLHPGTPFTCSQ